MASVVIPWRDGCPHRVAALEWVLRRYAEELPTWEVVVASYPRGPWRKGVAVSGALETVTQDPVVVADADCWTDGLESAARAVVCGAAEWAVPHDRVHRITREGTEAVLRGESWGRQPAGEAYTGRLGGGFVVAQRSTMEEVPIDPRFAGWGQEDESWAWALACLAGEPWRGEADLIHLWHPSPERQDRRSGSPESWRLMKQYVRHRDSPEDMRRLIEKAKEGRASRLGEQALYSDPALAVD